eukprot:scaffold3541_cov117-Isochrysis_galbana.AAC.12
MSAAGVLDLLGAQPLGARLPDLLSAEGHGICVASPPAHQEPTPHCADAFDAVSILLSRTWDGPGNPAPDGTPRRQFKMDVDLAGVLLAIVGAGCLAVKHLDDKLDKKFDSMQASNDKKFDNIDKKFESIEKKFESIDKKFESIQAAVSNLSARFENLSARFENLSARFERQYGFEEGVRSVRVIAPSSSGTEEGGAR